MKGWLVLVQLLLLSGLCLGTESEKGKLKVIAVHSENKISSRLNILTDFFRDCEFAEFELMHHTELKKTTSPISRGNTDVIILCDTEHLSNNNVVIDTLKNFVKFGGLLLTVNSLHFPFQTFFSAQPVDEEILDIQQIFGEDADVARTVTLTELGTENGGHFGTIADTTAIPENPLIHVALDADITLHTPSNNANKYTIDITPITPTFSYPSDHLEILANIHIAKGMKMISYPGIYGGVWGFGYVVSFAYDWITPVLAARVKAPVVHLCVFENERIGECRGDAEEEEFISVDGGDIERRTRRDSPVPEDKAYPSTEALLLRNLLLHLHLDKTMISPNLEVQLVQHKMEMTVSPPSEHEHWRGKLYIPLPENPTATIASIASVVPTVLTDSDFGEATLALGRTYKNALRTTIRNDAGVNLYMSIMIPNFIASFDSNNVVLANFRHAGRACTIQRGAPFPAQICALGRVPTNGSIEVVLDLEILESFDEGRFYLDDLLVPPKAWKSFIYAFPSGCYRFGEPLVVNEDVVMSMVEFEMFPLSNVPVQLVRRFNILTTNVVLTEDRDTVVNVLTPQSRGSELAVDIELLNVGPSPLSPSETPVRCLVSFQPAIFTVDVVAFTSFGKRCGYVRSTGLDSDEWICEIAPLLPGQFIVLTVEGYLQQKVSGDVTLNVNCASAGENYVPRVNLGIEHRLNIISENIGSMGVLQENVDEATASGIYKMPLVDFQATRGNDYRHGTTSFGAIYDIVTKKDQSYRDLQDNKILRLFPIDTKKESVVLRFLFEPSFAEFAANSGDFARFDDFLDSVAYAHVQVNTRCKSKSSIIWAWSLMDFTNSKWKVIGTNDYRTPAQEEAWSMQSFYIEFPVAGSIRDYLHSTTYRMALQFSYQNSNGLSPAFIDFISVTLVAK